MNVATNFTRNVWTRLAKKLPKLVNLSHWRWTIPPRWVGEYWRCFCCQRNIVNFQRFSTAAERMLFKSWPALNLMTIFYKSQKNLLGKAWKRGGNHVYSCIDVTFLGQIFHYFQKPSCHSEVKLQRVLKRNLFLNPVSQEFLPPEKQERAVNKKKHVQNNANQQKFKLALHNNIVTSHDAHDSFWMTEATSESFARFTGRKNPSSAFVPSVGTNNFAFGRKKGGSILQYLIFTTHHQPYLLLLRIEVDMIKTMTVSFPCISISLPGDNIIPLYTLYCFNLIHTDSIFHIDIPG